MSDMGRRSELVRTVYISLCCIYNTRTCLGPNEISLSRAEGIQTVLGQQGMTKGPYWSNRTAPGTTISLIAEPDPILHKQRRKPWDRAFNTASLKDYEEIVGRRSRELCDALEQRSRRREVVDLDMWISYFAFDFMGDMVFGAGFDLLSTGSDQHGMWHILEEGVRSAAIIGQTPWAFSLARLLPSIQARRVKLISSVKGMLEKRIESGSQRRDLYHHLSDGGEAPIPRVLNDAVLAVVAGKRPSFSLLVNSILYALRHRLGHYSNDHDRSMVLFASQQTRHRSGRGSHMGSVEEGGG